MIPTPKSTPSSFALRLKRPILLNLTPTDRPLATRDLSRNSQHYRTAVHDVMASLGLTAADYSLTVTQEREV